MSAATNDRDIAAARQLILGIRERGAQLEGVAIVVAGIRAEGYAEGVHQGRSDVLTVVEQMIDSRDPEAVVEALPRAEA